MTKRNTPPEQDSHAGTASRGRPPCPPPAAVTFYLAVPSATAVCTSQLTGGRPGKPGRLIQSAGGREDPPARAHDMGSGGRPPGNSAVCVARPPAPAHLPFPRPARRSRCPSGPADPHSLHRAVAELVVEPADQMRREQPDLGRPGGGIRRDSQFTVRQGLGPGVLGELGADNVGPPPENRPYGSRLPPAARVDQAADRGVQRLRVVAPGPAAGPAGRG